MRIFFVNSTQEIFRDFRFAKNDVFVFSTIRELFSPIIVIIIIIIIIILIIITIF